MVTRINERPLFRCALALGFALVIAALTSASSFAANCASAGTKCGLPIISFQSASSGDDLFATARAANPSLYPSDAVYHVFYDSRTRKVTFQDATGMNVTPDANARNFVVVWHDGSSTDWRSIDATLSARIPATAKADELAHIVWAIKAATLTPRVILSGGSQDLAYAKYYVAGQATPQFSGGAHAYNNDFQGMLASEGKVAPIDAATSALMMRAAADQYVSKPMAVSASAVRIMDGITSSATSVAPGQTIQFTSKMGPVVWSVMEGPAVGTINRNGLFTAKGVTGTAHIVAVSVTNHNLIAVATAFGTWVETTNAGAVTSSDATLNAYANGGDVAGYVYFAYSRDNFVHTSYTAQFSVPGDRKTHLVQAPLTKLPLNTTYSYRAIFNQTAAGGGVQNGSVVSFRTFGIFAQNFYPGTVTAITRHGATFPGEYGTGGGPARVWIEISTSPTFPTASVYGPFNVAAGTYATQQANITVSTLSAGTTYYVRYAIRNTENGSTVRSPVVGAFTTLP